MIAGINHFARRIIMPIKSAARRRGSRQPDSLFIWAFPVLFAAALSYALWAGTGYLFGKALPTVEKVLAMIIRV
jgi:hypothetical protein